MPCNDFVYIRGSICVTYYQRIIASALSEENTDLISLCRKAD